MLNFHGMHGCVVFWFYKVLCTLSVTVSHIDSESALH